MVFLYNLLDLKRTTWEGPELKAGKHTIVFDFKFNGPGLGKGGTGVLSVDGKEVAKNSLEHTTPILFPEDETFDVGQDTGTPLALLEYRYECPFTVHRQNQQADLQPRPRAINGNRAQANAGHRGPGSSSQRLDGPGAMKRVLIFAAVSEAATGVALLIVPALVGRLLFGGGTHRHRHTGGPCGRYRPVLLGTGVLAGQEGKPTAALAMLTYNVLVALYFWFSASTANGSEFCCGRQRFCTAF